MEQQLIDLKDHPHNLCPAGKLEWSASDRAVYSVRAGFVAVVGFGRCLNQTFQNKREAMEAARAA
jgi:hypothetical protein